MCLFNNAKDVFRQRLPVLFVFCTLLLQCVTGEPCDINEYYQSVDTNTGNGLGLKAKLHNLIKGHTVIPYTLTDEAFGIIDQNPTNPAQIIGIYSQVGLTNFPDDWNREHVFPRSRGVGDEGPDYSDMHNLFPCDASLNSARSNKLFDECSPSDNCKFPATGGSSVAASGSGSSPDFWQIPTVVRGDVARAIFYMATRYSDDTEPNTVELKIEECISSCGSNTFGRLSTLLKWNEDDPPDAKEIARNNAICSDYQGNRNPFVDYPDLVNRVFGDGSTEDPPEEDPNSLDEQTIFIIAGTATSIIVISAIMVLSIARGTRLRNCFKRKPSANVDVKLTQHYLIA
uniref:Uncharacterized protein n=1 Tax=Aplanochytrium stocchinoi TaxID=215587 RepID=A0A7S3V1X9_9STRA